MTLHSERLFLGLLPFFNWMRQVTHVQIIKDYTAIFVVLIITFILRCTDNRTKAKLF